MTEDNPTGRLSPQDERAAEKFFQIIGYGEVPISVHKNTPAFDLSFRHPESTQKPKNLSELSNE